MVIEYWLSNNAGGSVTANGIAGKVTIRNWLFLRIILSVIQYGF
ncbi:hypothetical protein P1I67_000038 [Escherichia coli]